MSQLSDRIYRWLSAGPVDYPLDHTFGNDFSVFEEKFFNQVMAGDLSFARNAFVTDETLAMLSVRDHDLINNKDIGHLIDDAQEWLKKQVWLETPRFGGQDIQVAVAWMSESQEYIWRKKLKDLLWFIDSVRGHIADKVYMPGSKRRTIFFFASLGVSIISVVFTYLLCEFTWKFLSETEIGQVYWLPFTLAWYWAFTTILLAWVIACFSPFLWQFISMKNNKEFGVDLLKFVRSIFLMPLLTPLITLLMAGVLTLWILIVAVLTFGGVVVLNKGLDILHDK